VIGTTSTAEKAELAKANGADHVLLSTDPSESNVKKILELAGKGVKVVYDGVGKDTWEEDFEVVAPLGTIVTFGNASVGSASPERVGGGILMPRLAGGGTSFRAFQAHAEMPESDETDTSTIHINAGDVRLVREGGFGCGQGG